MTRLPARDRIQWAIMIGLGLLLLLPEVTVAGGPVHGAKAAAMGTAFVAIADDPSAILHNPAGLTQLKSTNAYGGVTAVIPSTEYESPSGESEETRFQIFFPPHLYVSSDLASEKIAVGLGIFSPFGIGGRDWSEKGPTRYVSTENFIATIAVNPTLAWQIAPGLSLGVGTFYLHSFNTAERMIDQSAFGAEDGKFSLDADGGGWGYNFGVLLKPSDSISIGLAYRSHVSADQSGKVKLENIAPALQPTFGGSKFETNVDTTVDFPESVSMGIAYKPIKRITFALEAEYGNWSRFGEQELDLEDEVPAAGFTDTTIELDYRDAWIFKVGLDYELSYWLFFRMGYTYIQSPVPERTLSPANPDADQHNFSIGCGCRIGKWVVDGFYNAGFFEDRKVNNQILSGKYKNFAHMFGLSIGYGF